MLKRKTAISKKVLHILKNTNRALSVPQLLSLLAKANLTPNKTTVYRIMDKLVRNNDVSMITLKSGTSYYEFNTHHHHHFYCYSCEQLFCLSSCHFESSKFDIKALLPNENFKITSHDFNIYGECAPCANKSVHT